MFYTGFYSNFGLGDAAQKCSEVEFPHFDVNLEGPDGLLLLAVIVVDGHQEIVRVVFIAHKLKLGALIEEEQPFEILDA